MRRREVLCRITLPGSFFLPFSSPWFVTDYKIRQIQKTRPFIGTGRKFEITRGTIQVPRMMRSAHSGHVFKPPPLATVGESGGAYSALVLLTCAFKSATQEGYSEEVSPSALTVGQWP